MNPLEILQRTPKTNCGECGQPTCLAFAVAAHLEPEILIVDEVLAVGDAEFQNKCLNKMESVAKTGRTISLRQSSDR